MTGKDLIIYILQNNLENEEIFDGGIFVGFMSEREAAVKFNVGIESIRMWYVMDMLPGFEIGGMLYFLKDSVDPRARVKEQVP